MNNITQDMKYHLIPHKVLLEVRVKNELEARTVPWRPSRELSL